MQPVIQPSNIKLRTIIVSTGAAILAALVSLCAPSPAQAKDYPYCMSYASGTAGLAESCTYDSLDQCRPLTFGISGTCYANWRLAYRQQMERDAVRPSRRAR